MNQPGDILLAREMEKLSGTRNKICILVPKKSVPVGFNISCGQNDCSYLLIQMVFALGHGK